MQFVHWISGLAAKANLLFPIPTSSVNSKRLRELTCRFSTVKIIFQLAVSSVSDAVDEESEKED